ALLAAEVALVDRRVAGARPAELLPRPPASHGDEPERGRGAAVVVEPGVAALLVLHELRRARTELGREPGLPEIGRLDDVRVARDHRSFHGRPPKRSFSKVRGRTGRGFWIRPDRVLRGPPGGDAAEALVGGAPLLRRGAALRDRPRQPSG